MSEVTIRELRNNGAAVLGRVEHGESLTLTRDGEPVAQVVPLPRPPSRVELLIARRGHLPRVDSGAMRADIDSIIDASL